MEKNKRKKTAKKKSTDIAQVFIPNKVIQTLCPFKTIIEMRIFYIAVHQLYLNRNDPELRQTSDFMIHVKDLARESKAIYDNIEDILINLSKRQFNIRLSGDEFTIFNIFDQVSYNSGTITLRFTSTIFPILKNYSEEIYTKLPLQLFTQLSSIKRIHLSQILMSFIRHNANEGEFTILKDEIFSFFSESESIDWRGFSQKILNPALEQMHLLEDVKYLFRYLPIRKGKEVVAVKFEYTLKLPLAFLKNAFLQFMITRNESVAEFILNYNRLHLSANECQMDKKNNCELEKKIICCFCPKNKKNLFIETSLSQLKTS